MRRRPLILLAALTCAAVARGEPLAAEAPPAEHGDLAGRFLTWLTAESNAATDTADVLAENATRTTFDKSTKTDARDLAAHFAGGRVIATAVYAGRPTTLAADLSQQLQAAADVPAEKTASLIVHPARNARANQVAGDFAVEVLAAGENDVVGAAVIWYADVKRHSLLDGATPPMKLAMVLFVAPAAQEGAPLKIARIAIGDLPATK